MLRVLVLAGIPILFLVLFYVFVARDVADVQPAQFTKANARVGWWQDGGNRPAPDFSLPALNGDTLRLSDQLGKIVVLNFWATWCGPCREETPAFVKLHTELKDQGVQFIGLSIDEEGFDIVRPFVEEFGVTYPIVVDDGSVKPRYKEVVGMPTTFILNKNGEIEKYMAGAVSYERLRSVLLRMLRKDVEDSTS